MKLACISIFVLVFHTACSSFVFSDAAQAKVPAVYVFGDSTADVGNNNYLPGNDAKANFPHYGIDFPGSRATGRFSNAYNGIDFLVSHMGFKRSPPPYLSLLNNTGHYRYILKGLRGVSFASAGSGVLDTTGTTLTMTKQVQYFTELNQKVLATLGTQKTNYLLSKSIFLFSAGGNDVFAFAFQNPSANVTQVQQFYNLMTSNLETHIKALYNLGARKIALVDVAPIGCCPISRVQDPQGACLEPVNVVAKGVNDAIKALMSKLSTSLTGLKYSIGSSYAVISNIISNPVAAGYENAQSACCGSGTLNAVTMCSPNTTYCSNRGKYVFWDSIHPTHATSKKASLAIYSGSLVYASPINYQQLVAA